MNILLILSAVLLVVGLKYPPIFFFLLILLTANGDSLGMGGFLNSLGFGFAMKVINVIAIASSFVCFQKLWQRKNEDKSANRAFIMGSLAMFASIWIAFSTIVKYTNIGGGIGAFVDSRLYSVLIILAYWRSKRAQKLFITLLIIQLSLAATLVLFPDGFFSDLNATNYLDQEMGVREYYQQYTGSVARFIIDGHKDTRFFGQFHNPNQYGFYSIIGLVIGWYLFFYNTTKYIRIIGLVILIEAIFGWMVTFTRGATMGLLMGILAITIHSKNPRYVMRWFLLIILFLLTFFVFPFIFDKTLNIFLEPDSFDSRIKGLQFALENMFIYPLFGIPVELTYANNYYGPHQTVPQYIMYYGIPVGIVISIFTWWQISSNFIQDFKTVDHRNDQVIFTNNEYYLFIVIGWIVFGMGLTNFTGGGVLNWLCFAIACLPWVNSGYYFTHDIPRKPRRQPRQYR
jgi:hypothetical protein